MFKSSTWTVKLSDSSRVSVDVTYDTEGGDVNVDVIGDEWVEKRKGRMDVERTAIGNRVMFASVGSLLGDVHGEGRTAKQAAESYGSAVAQAVVDQRRRMAAAQNEIDALAKSSPKAFAQALADMDDGSIESNTAALVERTKMYAAEEKPEAELIEELLEEIVSAWRQSSRTSATPAERMAIEIVNLRARKAAQA
jgi:hypothetical protein